MLKMRPDQVVRCLEPHTSEFRQDQTGCNRWRLCRSCRWSAEKGLGQAV